MEIETRSGLPVEIRAKDDGSVIVEGYAAVFDQVAEIGGIFREVVRRGAFKNAIQRGDDVTFNVGHNDNWLLARTKSGTLKLTEDERGLRIYSELDPTDPDVARLVPKMKRGDLSEMSFAFRIPEGGQDWSVSADGLDLREIRDVHLHDVSVVPVPAYGGTSIALRSRDDDREKALKEQQESQKEHNQAAYLRRKAEQEQKFRSI